MTQETLVNTDSIRARLLWLSTIEEPSERERNICRQAAAALEQQQARIRELETALRLFDTGCRVMDGPAPGCECYGCIVRNALAVPKE